MSRERAGTPGARWNTELRWGGEVVVTDDEPEPRPNRATRRAARRVKAQQAREGAQTPARAPNSLRASHASHDPHSASETHSHAPRTNTTRKDPK